MARISKPIEVGCPPPEEMMILANKLQAIAEWQEDAIQSETDTGRLLRRSAYWLRAAAVNTCNQGYVGCRGGDKCNSDSHK